MTECCWCGEDIREFEGMRDGVSSPWHRDCFEKFGEQAAKEDQPQNPKDQVGQNKVPYHLIPSAPLAEVALVMAHGAAKYGPWNWRKIGVAHSIYVSAAIRHLRQHLECEDLDYESGISHLAHAAATLLILMDSVQIGNDKDDRPTPYVEHGWMDGLNAMAQQIAEE